MVFKFRIFTYALPRGGLCPAVTEALTWVAVPGHAMLTMPDCKHECLESAGAQIQTQLCETSVS